MPSGIIIKGIGGFYYVKISESNLTEDIYECKARGIFRKNEIAPLPGDRVIITIIDNGQKLGNIDEILPRASQLVRPAVANVNQVVIVIAAKSPAPDLILLDKLLITAEYKNLDAVICINKIDLDEDKQYENLIRAYSMAGYTIVPISSKMDKGFDCLKNVMQGKISALSGQSGVGKSTILNRIMNSMVMKTGNISEKIARGKHTTRHAELLELEFGGYLVDTPGFSSFELVDVEQEKLQLYYPEFQEHLNKCRFTGCTHMSEPDCSVKNALENGLIDLGRYDRYIQLHKTLKSERDYKNKSKR